MKNNSIKFGTYNKDTDNYVSLIDEYRRNKILYSSRIFNLNNDELWKVLKIVIQKTFNIKRELIEGLSFKFRINGQMIDYKVETFNEDTKEISLTWKIDNDQYWLTYKIIKINKFSKLNYKQIIFRQKTFFGFQDQVGLILYRRNFKKNIKSFNKSIIYQKNNPNNND